LRKYLGVASIIIFVLTLLIMKWFVEGKVRGDTGSGILMIGVGLSILSVIFCEKGRLKIIVLSFYGVLIVGFITIAILFGWSGL
jgi:hypothetical protein